MSIQQMRKSYSMAGFCEKDADPDPLVQFRRWFEQAQQPDLPDWVEVNAMTLSTADATGLVTSRVVLLKGIDRGKLCFFTNYGSAKGQQMEVNPRVALCFFWPHLQRQVRIQGTVSKTDRRQSEDYFHSRPRDSQLGAYVSKQSAVIANRDLLEQRMAECQVKYQDLDIPCPENWGGYAVEPTEFEFWQGRPSRLHDRICYRRREDDWEIVRLAP